MSSDRDKQVMKFMIKIDKLMNESKLIIIQFCVANIGLEKYLFDRGAKQGRRCFKRPAMQRQKITGITTGCHV